MTQAPEGWSTFITFVVLGTDIIILITAGITFWIYTSNANSSRKAIIRKASALALIGTFIIVIIFHFIAFSVFANTWFSYKGVDYDPQVTYTIFNYPGSYSSLDSNWPFSQIILIDSFVALVSTLVIAGITAGIYIFTRSSIRQIRGKNLRKLSIIYLSVAVFIDVLIGGVIYFLNLSATQRPFFLITFLLCITIIIMLAFTTLVIFENKRQRGTNTQVKSLAFSARMGELNKRLTAASTETDQAIDEMLEAIEEHKRGLLTLDKSIDERKKEKEQIDDEKKKKEEEYEAFKKFAPETLVKLEEKLEVQGKKSRAEILGLSSSLWK